MIDIQANIRIRCSENCGKSHYFCMTFISDARGLLHRDHGWIIRNGNDIYPDCIQKEKEAQASNQQGNNN